MDKLNDAPRSHNLRRASGGDGADVCPCSRAFAVWGLLWFVRGGPYRGISTTSIVSAYPLALDGGRERPGRWVNYAEHGGPGHRYRIREGR